MAEKINPGQYVREVRQEVGKVTWPSRRETMITTAMVFVFVFLAAVFFFFADMGLAALVRMILGLGG